MAASIFVLFQLFYILLSIALYFIEIHTMFLSVHKHKFNKSAFNKLFVIYAINNMFAEILYYFFFQMMSAPIFFPLFKHLVGYNFVLALFWQLTFHFTIAANLLDFVLSFNRFTALSMPIRYTTFWNGKVKWIVVFIFVFPWLCFWPFVFGRIMMIYSPASESYYMMFTEPPPIQWPSPTSILGTFVTVTCIGCLLCNTYVGLKLYRRRYVMTDSNYEQEKLYFFFVMCVFTTQLLGCSTQVTLFWIFFEKLMFQWMLTYLNENISNFIIRYQFIIADLGSLLPAWALFLMNSALRRAIYKTLIRAPNEDVVNTRIRLSFIANNSTPK